MFLLEAKLIRVELFFVAKAINLKYLENEHYKNRTRHPKNRLPVL